MKVQTELDYETLRKALGLARGLRIELVEVDRLKGTVQIVVQGEMPPRTRTDAGFSPDDKRSGCEPDRVNFYYLQE